MGQPAMDNTGQLLAKAWMDSPLGAVSVRCGEHGIQSVSFDGETSVQGDSAGLAADCISQLEEYFLGKRKQFDLPLDPQGTDFQKSVWSELMKIPYGKTISYRELARRLGDEKVIRAAAAANGANPIAILIPCHRVVGSHGELTGYAAGLHRKKWLLEHERGERQTSLFSGNP
jgi:methylated-DNA-[protein]-cysteine S-methyltransferase